MILSLLVAAALAREPLPPEPQAAGQEAEAPVQQGLEMVVTLSDGQVLNGRATQLPDGSVRLRLHDGRELGLPAEVVARVRPAVTSPATPPPRWGPDPNRSRYLYSPSAFSQGHGNGYLAQRALVLTSAAVGVSDYVDLEVGLILPTLFTSSPVGAFGVKVSGPVEEHLRLGAGAQAILIPVDGLTAGGFLFGNATLGSPDTHGTLSGGVVMDFTGGEVMLSAATLSVNHRLGPGMALVSENWFLYFMPERQGDTLYTRDGPWGIPFFAVPSGGVRLFGPSFAVDLALVPVITGEREIPILPLPWISVAWNWGS